MSNIVIQRVDVFELIGFLDQKNKLFQATALSQIEGVIDPKSEEYRKIRKVILDGFNDYNRCVVNTIFGNVEK